MEGVSFGIPLLKFISSKVAVFALNDLWSFLENNSLALHEQSVKTVYHQNNFG